MIDGRPFVVGLGGAATPVSSTERALNVALSAAEHAGASVQLFGSATLIGLPHYLTSDAAASVDRLGFIEAIRKADGLILASPGYHGSISGLVKNAIDYLEETAGDDRAYLDGIPVGVVATAYGWQGANCTVAALRSIVHALRGWVTPMAAALNCAGGIFDGDRCTNPVSTAQLELVGRQVVQFAQMKIRHASY